jgi:hypothetical protein
VKRVSLSRLRDISKQKSIRGLPTIRPDGDRPEDGGEIEMATIEWPVPGSNHF